MFVTCSITVGIVIILILTILVINIITIIIIKDSSKGGVQWKQGVVVCIIGCVIM